MTASACAAESSVPQVATTSTVPTTEATASTQVADVEETTTLPTYRLPDGLPEGSGCTPNLAAGLPRGVWFGYLRAADLTTITFDLACYYEGDQAVAAAATDGVQPGDGASYVRNVDPTPLELPVNAGISIQALDETGERVDTGDWYAQWVLTFAVPEEGAPVWIIQQPDRISALVHLDR